MQPECALVLQRRSDGLVRWVYKGEVVSDWMGERDACLLSILRGESGV